LQMKTASTEPRPRGRGNGFRPIQQSRGFGRFNGAAPARARKYYEGDVDALMDEVASTEPRPRGRGNKAVRITGDFFRPASTEPRPRGRGNSGRKTVPAGNLAASTEPRPRGRGNLQVFSKNIL